MSTTQLAPAELDRVFSALADPTRREILTRLGAGDATVNELAEPFPISLPAISRHLKVLERAGLITRDRRAQWRSSSLQAAPLKEATTWMEHLTQLWDARFDRLDAHLEVMKRIQNQQTPGQPDANHKEKDND
ncbi:MAG: ArsR/SmtB family transcription factor [Aeromicrobium sp.]